MGQLVGYLDLGCTQPQANPKRLVSFSHAGGGDPVDFLMSLGSVLPGCVSSAASCISAARWLFKTCAVGLEQAGPSCCDFFFQLRLHLGDAEATFMACSQRGPVLFFPNLPREALEGNSNRMICCSWGRGLCVKERIKPLWLAASAEWWVLGSGGGGPMKSSPPRWTHLHRKWDEMHSGYRLFLGKVQAP